MLKILVSAATLIMLPIAAQAVETGKPAPAFSVNDITGAPQSIDMYKGKVIVLEWNNYDCPFVKKHYDTSNMQNLQHEITGKGVVWLTINSSAAGKQGHMDATQAKAKLLEVKAHQTAYILDPKGEIGHLYNAKVTPHMYVINQQGNIAYQGAIDDKSSTDKDDIKLANNHVRAAVDNVLASKNPEVAETKAYGCGIKYE